MILYQIIKLILKDDIQNKYIVYDNDYDDLSALIDKENCANVSSSDSKEMVNSMEQLRSQLSELHSLTSSEYD